MSIEENNKLVAEFMDYNIASEVAYINEFSWVEQYRDGTVEDLEYHKSWDWLMPVVEKIETLFGNRVTVQIKSGEYGIWLHNQEAYEIKDYNTYDYYSAHWEEDKLMGVYNQVVKFIEWYNKNK